MKRFIKTILIFFAAIAIADIAFGALCRYFSKHARGGDTHNQYVTTMIQQAPVIIMGSSRAARHYNPAILADTLGREVWNCGLDGNGLLFQYGRLRLLLERYTPQTIIYDVIPAFDIREEDNLKAIKWLNRWADHAVLDSLIDDVDPAERIKLFSSFYRYNTSFLHMAKDNVGSPQIFDHGFLPFYDRMDYDGKGPDDKPSVWQPLKREYFEKFINLCREKNIHLIVVYSPWYKARSNRSLEPVTTLCREKGVPVIDHYADPEWVTAREMFADPSHLNDRGADVFSSQIASEIKKVETSTYK